MKYDRLTTVSDKETGFELESQSRKFISFPIFEHRMYENIILYT